jgi:hypothetical protein
LVLQDPLPHVGRLDLGDEHEDVRLVDAARRDASVAGP